MSQATDSVRHRSNLQPEIGLVLGSGLGDFADRLQNSVRIPYSDIPGLPTATATGHKSELIIGTDNGTPVAAMAGRFHLYEGYSAQQVVAGIRLFHELGIKTVVLTNAAGGIHPSYGTGALVLVSDHINLQGANPLTGANNDALGPRFPDMTEAYAPELRRIAQDVAHRLEIELHEGVYAAMLGPSYETPAEIRFLRTVGADLVGMSTALETVAANHLGMRVLGISCVTNLAAGLSGQKLHHQEVLEIGRKVSTRFIELLGALLPELARAAV